MEIDIQKQEFDLRRTTQSLRQMEELEHMEDKKTEREQIIHIEDGDYNNQSSMIYNQSSVIEHDMDQEQRITSVDEAFENHQYGE